jgi:hypothetical protein
MKLFITTAVKTSNLLIVARQRLGKNPTIVARQRLGRNVTAVTNTHATIEELLYASFSMWPVSYQGKSAISSSQNFLLFYSVCLFSDSLILLPFLGLVSLLPHYTVVYRILFILLRLCDLSFNYIPEYLLLPSIYTNWSRIRDCLP